MGNFSAEVPPQNVSAQRSCVPVESSCETPGLSPLPRRVETTQAARRNTQSHESNPGNRCHEFIGAFYNLIMLDRHFQSCVLSHEFTLRRCRRPHLKHMNPDLINSQRSLTPIKYREFVSGCWNQLI